MQSNTIIKIQGQLDIKWKSWFDCMDISYNGKDTILEVYFQDESQKYGLINKLRDLNLKLISLNPIESTTDKSKNN